MRLALILTGLVFVSCSGSSTDVRAQSAQEEPVPVRISTRPVSLNEMVKAADRIFVGEVVEVKNRPHEFKGVEEPTQVREVTFKISEVIKDDSGDIPEGGNYSVIQLPEISRNVKKGQKLLWYLAPNDPELGLTQPVGVDSGHFRITVDAGGESQVINLKGNQNLLNVASLQDKSEHILSYSKDPKTRSDVLSEIKTLQQSDFRKPGKAVGLDLLIGETKRLAGDSP